MGTSAVLYGIDQPKQKFPLVAKAKNNDLHVLFASEKEGTVIVAFGSFELGDYKAVWESCFKKEYWTILDSVTITFKS